jgi:hypothetical protein
LWNHINKNLEGDNLQYDEPDNKHDIARQKIKHSVNFFHYPFCVTQCQSKCSPLPKGIHLDNKMHNIVINS